MAKLTAPSRPGEPKANACPAKRGIYNAVNGQLTNVDMSCDESIMTGWKHAAAKDCGTLSLTH